MDGIFSSFSNSQNIGGNNRSPNRSSVCCLLHAHSKRPRLPPRPEERDNEFSPSDVNCHVTLSWGVMPMEGTIPLINRAVCVLLHTPMAAQNPRKFANQ